MQYKLLLARSENIKEVEAQEQARFVKSTLEALEVPHEFNPDEPLTIECKLKLRKSLDAFNMNIIDDMNGGIKIYVGAELTAEWKKVSCKMKLDKTIPDPKKQLYTEMTINFWTALEQGG